MISVVQRAIRVIKEGRIGSVIKDRIIRIIFFVMPKKNNLWVYGSWDGFLYADNPKYMFEYMNENHSEISSVWITRDSSICDKVRQKGYPCYLDTSLKGLLCCAHAKVAFVTVAEKDDISIYMDYRKTKVIELWHGFGAKKMNWSDAEGHTIKDLAYRYGAYYWMSSSEFCTEVLAGNMGLEKDRFYVTGFPRNDVFINKPYSKIMEELITENPDYKFVIYMPTHRNFGKGKIDYKYLRYVDQRLGEIRLKMVYKPHVHELKNVMQISDSFENIIIATDKETWGDVYSYIHYFDALISDYSSIAYDFLCSGKPIVQFTYDIDDYKNNDGGLLDFFEDIPIGPFTFTWDDTLNELDKMLHVNDEWLEKRTNALRVFYEYNDGRNRERVYHKVLEIADK